MLDVGLGELLVLALLALLVFGPDRLPKVASDAARTLRQVRQMASAARRDLADAAGIDDDPQLAQAVRDLRDLDPRRALHGLDDEPAPRRAAAGGTGGAGAVAADNPAAADAVAAPAPVDPDWT